METKSYKTPTFERLELSSGKFFTASSPSSPSFAGTANQQVTTGDNIKWF